MSLEDLTEEDRAAWFDWQVNRRRDWLLWGALERVSFPADRSAAAMLYGLESMRAMMRFFGPRAYGDKAIVHCIMKGAELKTGEVQFP